MALVKTNKRDLNRCTSAHHDRISKATEFNIRRRKQMRRTLFLSCIILCATWVCAQTGSTQNPSSASSQAVSNEPQTTITGCLSGSSGNYTLTDKSGTAYQLTGDTNGMNDHVGHTIKVTGSSSSSTNSSPNASNSTGSSSGSSSPSSSASASGTGSQNTFNVSSFKHVSKTCNSTH